MKIINFEDARKQLKEKAARNFHETDNWKSELMKPYQELVQLCEKLYDEHD